MRKVIVIGCPGAGKSTFARRLRDQTGLPLYHLDMLWHRPDRTTVSREEFDMQLERLLKQNCWILDGNYQRTLEKRLLVCDTVFLLDLPLEVCLLVRPEKICPGSNRNLIQNSGSGLSNSLKIICHRFTVCWSNTRTGKKS